MRRNSPGKEKENVHFFRFGTTYACKQRGDMAVSRYELCPVAL
jgi:hypothetical protein